MANRMLQAMALVFALTVAGSYLPACGGGGGSSTPADVLSGDDGGASDDGGGDEVTYVPLMLDDAAWKAAHATSDAIALGIFDALGFAMSSGDGSLSVGKADLPAGVLAQCGASKEEVPLLTLTRDGMSFEAWCETSPFDSMVDIEEVKIVFDHYIPEGSEIAITGRAVGRVRLDAGYDKMTAIIKMPENLVVESVVPEDAASSIAKSVPDAQVRYSILYNGFTGVFALDGATGAILDYHVDYLFVWVYTDEGHYYECYISDSETEADCTWRGQEICDNGIDDSDDGYRGVMDCQESICRHSDHCEMTPAKCRDGIDNDGDGYIDCNDTDCAKVREPVFEYDSVLVCNEDCCNGIDDDDDGAVDCQDLACVGALCDTGPDCMDCGGMPGCYAGGVVQPGSGLLCSAYGSTYSCKTYGEASCCAPATEPVCYDFDTIDDDLDGLLNCDDPDCSWHDDCIAEICDNGIDDDGDGPFDCYDSDCDDDPYCDESQNCGDGIDNDWDGKIDCEDLDCEYTGGCVESVCDDGIDNDGDGDTDCADTDCRTGSYDPICGEKICDDGINNDMDKNTDCLDPDCFCDPVCPTPPATEENCSDGFDNDCDGDFDCDDPDCADDTVCTQIDCYEYCVGGLVCEDNSDCTPPKECVDGGVGNDCWCCR